MSGEGLREFSVRLVFPDSPAAKAGIAVGDKLVRVDGKPASSFDKEALYKYLERPGKRVEIELTRDGKPLKITLKLERLV
jgi:S1-C subfamily serine protease